MTGRRASALVIWLICIVAAAMLVVRARYVADLSAFLPADPTPTQQLLVDQLRDGPASRLILMAVEGGDAAARAKITQATAVKLRRDPQFLSINNGEAGAEQSDREFLFKHRYLLSDAVDAQRFSAAGLHAALLDTIDSLASPAGLLFKSLLPRDPTGELLHIVDRIADAPAPQSKNGVWVSADGQRTLAVAQTAANGSDSDAQERAVNAIHAAFAASLITVPGAAQLTLKLSGPGVFAVAARAKIERAAIRLSIASGILVVAMLLFVYRSLPALGFGLLPVASGALMGIAAVALGFGVVHGITLGFGITLIGESVDYSIYFFIQSRQAADTATSGSGWVQQWWPTIRLGMLTSVFGFASLLPSGFPGLQQLGLYSISGLIVAALVTRFVLPAFLPSGLAIRDVSPFGARIAALLQPLGLLRDFVIVVPAVAIAGIAVLILYLHRDSLWNRELAALSPISLDDQNYDARLRADLGAADVRDLVVLSGADVESVLRSAERLAAVLQPLVDDKTIGSFESPANYLPSMATQESRRSSLPNGVQLRDNLRQATADLPLRTDRLQPFIEDVEATRHAPLIGAKDLRGTSLGAGFDSLMLHQRDHWTALLPLRAPAVGQPIDVSRINAALMQAQIKDARLLDLKQESDALYDEYLNRAIHLSLAGFLALTVLLLVTLRSIWRVARVLAPLVLSVLTVSAVLALAGVHLTILHLVGMLLIVAVGSNYALFFDRQAVVGQQGSRALTIASLVIANASTVIGFGLLSFSQVPVLVALGTTVAPGAFLALLFAALLSPMTDSHMTHLHA